MSSRLPARRFREAHVLAGVSLVLPLVFVVFLLQGLVSQADAVVGQGRRAAQATARLLADGGTLERVLATAPSAAEPGLAEIREDRMERTRGLAGPVDPAWWPFASRSGWERAGRPVAGPLTLSGEPVLVAYGLVDGGGAVRVVQPLPDTLFVRWGWRLGALILIVAGAGAIVSWLMISRSLAPYEDLLAEAGRLSPPAPGDGEDRYLVETFRAAVERLEASEAELRRRADELEILADVLTRGTEAGVVITDRDGTIRARNAAAAELAGAPLAEGETLPEALAAEGRATWADREVEVRRLPLLSPSGDPQGEARFIADRSRLAALERAVQEQEQLATLGEMAAGMAHELRNALATVVGYVRLLPDAAPEARERYLDAISAETATVGEVLDRFLQFARPERLRLEPVAVAETARGVAARVGALFPAAAFTVTGDEAEVDADPLALTVVLENLLRNAGEAAASAVAVTVTAAGDAVRVVVEDDGPGVDAELRQRVFSPFATTKPSGGIGLALARRLVRLHGGDLTLEDGGAGARFVVVLPAREER